MSYTLEDRTIALAGVFQVATLVHQIAHRGTCEQTAMESSLQSLFVTNPRSTVEVFGDFFGVRLGLREMGEVLDRQTNHKDIEILRYALNLVHLSGKLRRHRDMLDLIGKRLDQARHTADHFGCMHSNTLSNLASVYLDSISTFSLRIQVTGNPSHLRVDSNAIKIRALLLAGIRSAILWHQTGGRRWQLIFGRQRYIQSARRLSADLGGS